jgi:hypothetical protein
LGDSTAMTRRPPTRNDLELRTDSFQWLCLPGNRQAGDCASFQLQALLPLLQWLRIDHILTLRSSIRVLLLKRFRILLRPVVHGVPDAGLRC